MEFHNKIFPQLRQHIWKQLNLNELAKEFDVAEPNPLLDADFCENWIHQKALALGIDRPYGGYLEDRSTLWRGHYHETGHVIHLGVDYVVPTGTYVYAPFDAEVIHSWIDRDNNGGWGGRVIVKHQNGYCIFGHLDGIPSARRLLRGEVFSRIAPKERNGNWFPHLHVQGISSSVLDGTSDLKAIDGYSRLYEGIRNDYPLVK